MVEIKNLYKNYGELQAVCNISLSVPKGQVLGLLGPNGAGKSTTLRILTGFLEASSGEVHIGGHSVSEEPLETRRLIGYLPESTPLYENMLVYDYLHFVAQSRNTPQADCLDKIRRAAKRCDIIEFIHRPIGELSKGQRQRVGLAMAILDDPEVLILDEPTSGLDPNQIIGIRDIIRELGKEKTIIFSTHILSEAEATCDRVVIINKGQIAAEGSIAELKQSQGAQSSLNLRIEGSDEAAVQSAFMVLCENEAVLGEGAKVESRLQSGGNEILVTLSGDRNDSDEVRQSIKAIIRDNDWFMLGMESKSHSLEDIFRELTN
ncbi:ATP-binding cassette domain-containing protein [Candidatus Haliotispira prima]|uniref:ATP-binding cassette domain-containing protein n=1 Tax=Candidatus Haliotispira prima TaxID=3034016 RepID=A0ABY8MJJ9_9SPIO|nr:ATP-binding cassette domain-containing protein [Candidatus Haliotispira prima]